ncbi:MAG TPA: hypothetical protein VFG54_21295 [Prolixibacteraceae bacterium]|nr:hypothetical protein [Prolixibacteraceae bacterium]
MNKIVTAFFMGGWADNMNLNWIKCKRRWMVIYCAAVQQNKEQAFGIDGQRIAVAWNK